MYGAESLSFSMMPSEPTHPAYEEALNYLLGRINFERMSSPPYAERSLKLDRMRRLLTRLGNPDIGLPIVHIAGTKGKGSTSAMLAAVLEAANYSPGVFSSPHLERIEERLAVNGRPCEPDELVAEVAALQPVVAQIDQEADAAPEAQLRPTFFEIVTALALRYFARRQVDLAVLEVGLGGRLDATNVCQPAVTAITSISLDHTRQLGDTLPKIAVEKAGIIKPGVPVVVGQMPDGPRAVIESIARERGSRAIVAGRDFAVDFSPPNLASFHLLDAHQPFELASTSLALRGQHQAQNAAVVIAIALELRRQGWLISTEAMRRGLARTVLPGRVEVVNQSPLVVLDVAHNVASASALRQCLEEQFEADQKILVLAATKEKDAAGIAKELLPWFDRLIVTQYQANARAVPAEQLAELCRPVWAAAHKPLSADRFQIVPRPEDAWALASREAGGKDLICVTGSFFLVAELRGLATQAFPAAAHADQTTRS